LNPQAGRGFRPHTNASYPPPARKKKETSRDQKLTRKNIDQDHRPVMHQTTIPAKISTPENQSAGARKRAREREREKRGRAPECRPDGDEAALSLIRAG